MGELRVLMPKQGDDKLDWDPNDKDSVRRARKRFNKYVKPKKQDGTHKAYKVDTKTGKRTADEIKTFDSALGEIMLVPQMAGG